MYPYDNGADAESRHARPDGTTNGSHAVNAPTIQPGNTPSDDDFDALAGMFLDTTAAHSSDETARPELATPHRAAGRVPVRALILGHLPVMASAWPAQHARVRAEATGAPVVIARLSRGVLTVEAIGPTGPTQPSQSQAEALAWAASHAESVLVRVDEADEAELASVESVDQLIFLTGADDAAVVACYRKLKSIADRAGEDQPLPKSQLTIVGAGATRGRLTHERIARAARAFLEADLLEPMIVDRVAPTHSRVLYSGPTTLTVRSLIAALHTPAAEHRAVPTPSGPAVQATTEPVLIGELNDPVFQQHEPIVSCTVTETCPPTISLPRERPQSQPAGRAATTTKLHAEPVLASLVPGLLPLESACPVAPGVALAYDAAGVLHLLAASLVHLPDLSTEAPVRALLRASAWARSHASLLVRAEPRLAADAADHAEMHLVTDRSSEALAVLDTPIRVHLAAPVGHGTHGLVTVALDR